MSTKTHREGWVWLVFCAVLAGGCQTIQFVRPHVTTTSDWPTDGQTAQRSRALDLSLSVPLTLAWKYNANAGFGAASPLRLQDRILLGNRKGEIHAVELESGRGRGFKQLGEVIEGSPLIYEGMLYVPISWGRRTLVAFDLAAGAIRWQQRGIPFGTALIAHRDLILGIDLEGTIRAYAMDDGREAWTLSLGTLRTFKASPVRISESSVLFVDVTGTMYAVDLDTQTVTWVKHLRAPVYHTPAVSETKAAVTTARGSVYLLNTLTGDTVWSWQGPEHIRMGAPALGPSSVLAGATDGRIRSFARDSGEIEWEAAVEDVISAPPLVMRDHAFVGTLGKELLGLDVATGEVLWRTEVDGRIKSAMAVAEGGLLVLTEPRWLLYYRPENEGTVSDKKTGDEYP